jgi:hypothetical protein
MFGFTGTDPYANEAATIGQCGPLWLDSRSSAYSERSTKPCVASCRPIMAPHLAPLDTGGGTECRGTPVCLTGIAPASDHAGMSGTERGARIAYDYDRPIPARSRSAAERRSSVPAAGSPYDRRIMSPVIQSSAACRLTCTNGRSASRPAARLTMYSPHGTSGHTITTGSPPEDDARHRDAGARSIQRASPCHGQAVTPPELLRSSPAGQFRRHPE